MSDETREEQIDRIIDEDREILDALADGGATAGTAESEQPYQVMPELDAEEYEALKEDIRQNGIIVPITIDEDGQIIDGYHRMRIAEELGIEDPPTRERKGLSEEEKLSLAWRLNMQRRHVDNDLKKDLIKERLNELIDLGVDKNDEEIADELACSRQWVSEQRKKVVNEKLAESEEGGESASGGNFATLSDYASSDQKERVVKDLLVENPDESNRSIAEQLGVSKDTVGNHRDDLDEIYQPQLLNTDAKAVLPQVEAESVDLIVTDPPYGIGFDGNRYQTDSYEELRGDQDTSLITSVADELARVLKPDRHCYVFTRWDVLPDVLDAYSNSFDVDTVIVWDKDDGGHGMGDLEDWAPRHELIVKCSKGDRPLQDGRPPNVIRQQDVRFTDDENEHPTQKPTQLLQTLIEQSSQTGELVFDPFGGVHSTALAAVRTKRRCLSVEVETEYHVKGRERVTDAVDAEADGRTMILETEVVADGS